MTRSRLVLCFRCGEWVLVGIIFHCAAVFVAWSRSLNKGVDLRSAPHHYSIPCRGRDGTTMTVQHVDDGQTLDKVFLKFMSRCFVHSHK